MVSLLNISISDEWWPIFSLFLRMFCRCEFHFDIDLTGWILLYVAKYISTICSVISSKSGTKLNTKRKQQQYCEQNTFSHSWLKIQRNYVYLWYALEHLNNLLPFSANPAAPSQATFLFLPISFRFGIQSQNAVFPSEFVCAHTILKVQFINKLAEKWDTPSEQRWLRKQYHEWSVRGMRTQDYYYYYVSMYFVFIRSACFCI